MPIHETHHVEQIDYFVNDILLARISHYAPELERLKWNFISDKHDEGTFRTSHWAFGFRAFIGYHSNAIPRNVHSRSQSHSAYWLKAIECAEQMKDKIYCAKHFTFCLLELQNRVWSTSIATILFCFYAIAVKKRIESKVCEVSTRTTNLDKESLPSLCAQLSPCIDCRILGNSKEEQWLAIVHINLGAPNGKFWEKYLKTTTKNE